MRDESTAQRLSPLAIVAVAVLTAGCAGWYAPTAPDDNWNVVETTRLSLYVRPASFCESVARRIGDVLEDQYDHTVRQLALRTSGRVSLFLYNDGAESTPPLGAPRSGVAFPDTGALHAVCAPPFDDGLASLLAHELNHVVVQQGWGRAGTSFMNEGLASALVSERFGPIGPTFLRQWARTHAAERIPIATLVDDGHWDSSSQQGYNTSASFLAWLLERYGRERLKAVYDARSSEIGARVQETYGRSLDALQADWVIDLEGL